MHNHSKRMNNRIKHNHYISVVALFALLVYSCNGNVAYNKSADVHQQGWTPADTAFFDITVEDSIPRGQYNTLKRDVQYDFVVSLRYSDRFEYTTMPLHIVIDSVSYLMAPRLKRESAWGSINQEEFQIKGVPVIFSETGSHTIAIVPDTTYIGVYSIGINLQ